MSQKPKLFGADYSVYVRAVRLALHEKGVDYDLVPVDVFAASGPPSSYLARQPFGRIPAFEHDSFNLYESGAITRYLDEAFEGPRLQPATPKQRARMNQIISIADGYIYSNLVWGMYVELVSKPLRGEPSDERRVAIARSKVPVCLQALADLMDGAPWLGGETLTLADLHVAPMMDYFLMVPEARGLLEQHAALASWWQRMVERPSMRYTNPRREAAAAGALPKHR
ncbi:glutathione S-transferase family protein [Rhizobium sullae]|uniref:glutathione transferase n=1 Tax=Rhizobium sullae TaxID=50338 RepID=A0A2N0D5S5_RHISU|nr:glutathione S-transferase family protein [Rhizobium sullae]PKA41451.1 glutathione S-transferase family protein [Rhizobium sullae]UWU13089.1 glutathione S-transferase family protein [Rhizobium sullae]